MPEIRLLVFSSPVKVPPVFLFLFFLFPVHAAFSELQDQVLRVFKADQQSRYLLINRDTTAREAANMVIREFGLTAGPEAYSLCEVSVTPEGVTKQRRLPDQLNKLADRIQLCARCISAHYWNLFAVSFHLEIRSKCCCVLLDLPWLCVCAFPQVLP